MTLNFNVVAPATPGTYNFQVQMVHECVEFFPDPGPNVVVNVQPAPIKKALFLAQNVPSTMVAGQAYSVSVTIQNVGNVIWSPIGPQCNAYRLGSANSNTWGVRGGRVELPAAVAPGQQVTLNFTVIAPSTPGQLRLPVADGARVRGVVQRPQSTKCHRYRHGAPIWEGYHDIATCRDIYGWAWDQNWPNAAINVDVYRDNPYVATVPANVFRQDLLNAGKGNGYHGFDYVPDSSWRDGQWHSASVRFGGTGTSLNWTPRNIICGVSMFPPPLSPQYDLPTQGLATVATQFRSSQNGYITDLGFFRSGQETGSNTLRLWTDSGNQLASAPTSCNGSGWCWASLSPAVAISAGTLYRVSVNLNSYQWKTPCGIGSGITNQVLTAPQGFWDFGDTFPTTSSCSNFFVDVKFDM